MDRFDAILEHLKEAQSRSRESVASRLDTVVASLEQLIDTAKSTVQDAVPADAEDMLPVAEVEAMIAELRSQPAPTSGVSLESLRVLDQARSQSELLRALLPIMSQFVGRAAVLVIREGVVTAWSGIGFADAEQLRSWNGGLAASPDLSKLSETSRPRRFAPAADPLFSEWLAGETVPEEAVLLPISLRGKLMGMVYVDHRDDQPWDLEAAQTLNAVACWLIDTLHHRTTVPSPMLADIDEAEPEQPAPSDEVFAAPAEVEAPAEIEFEDQPPAPPVEPPAAEPAATPELESLQHDAAEAPTFAPEPAAAEPEPAEEEESIELDYDFGASAEETARAEEPAPAEPEFDPSATIRVEVGDDLPAADLGAAAEPAMPEPEVAPPPPPEPPPEPPAAAPAEEVEAPPPVRPVEPPAAPEEEEVPAIEFGRTPEDEAKLEEARRFARLLVSEIKLYNEEEVEKGRAAKDLGERLKEDIERSREMYEKRISPEIRQDHDYFQDELIRILADGDAQAIGG
jgi:hypothetical protein